MVDKIDLSDGLELSEFTKNPDLVLSLKSSIEIPGFNDEIKKIISDFPYENRMKMPHGFYGKLWLFAVINGFNHDKLPVAKDYLIKGQIGLLSSEMDEFDKELYTFIKEKLN